ncbi:hypothetical protein AMATHDRAFT_48577 [Amanita thiersii Skay4041]|uniref:Crinkler effector protein N-terminal domain-containing protein n=1 Tax=Amanita thiersii Skay4041 TaxID=703135 RepID=A0A2A9NMQ1_9AGAR|nr:hypothetical protein AMATHDRAFT_48577 [Amanita thiersii Skay4041]
MSTDVELTCYIDGAPIGQLFPVFVNPNFNVSNLKKVIKNEQSNTFMHVDASELVIWKLVGQVSIEHALIENVNPSTAERKKLLNPMTRLSSFFFGPPDPAYLHPIIAPPSPHIFPPTLACHFLGKGADQGIFLVKVDWSMDVNALKEAIKNTRSEIKDVLIRNLILWRCSIPIPSKATVDIAIPVSRSPLRNMERLADRRHPFEVKRSQCLKTLMDQIPAPSRATDIHTLMSMHKDVFHKYCICHRPSGISVPPITLLHRVFANFEDNVQKLQPTHEDWSFARNLSLDMAKFYPSEEQRVQRFRHHFQDNGLGIETVTIDDSTIKSDGAHQHHSLKFILTEGKNEPGVSHDSFFQVLFYYAKHVTHVFETNENLARTSFPCILLFYNGPFFGLMGALFTSGVQYELIGPVLPLFWNQRYPQFDLQLARVLGSIKQAVNESKICYPQGQPVKTENIENDCPYITSFQAAGKTTLVSDLHERGLVHGDIQKENLLVGPEHGKKKALKLIDFDYAGREGEACHPPHLHPDIEAATDAYRHGPITYKHDIDMLEKLCLGLITSSQGVRTRSRTRAQAANIRTNLKV